MDNKTGLAALKAGLLLLLGTSLVLLAIWSSQLAPPSISPTVNVNGVPDVATALPSAPLADSVYPSSSIHWQDIVLSAQHLLNSSRLAGAERDMLFSVLDMYADVQRMRRPVNAAMPGLIPGLSVTVPVHPISFSIPEQYIAQSVPPKWQPFSTVFPGRSETYLFMPTSNHTASRDFELLYHLDMQRSLFCVTFKKCGWDCMRHLEILASGCLPVFLDIKSCPKATMAAYPKNILKAILGTPGLNVTGQGRTSQERSNISLSLTGHVQEEVYTVVSAALISYTYNVLSTRAMARYMLSVMGNTRPQRILYLTIGAWSDYLTDTLLHGLKVILGNNNVVDYPPRNPIYKRLEHFNGTDFTGHKHSQYGRGFSYAATFTYLPGREVTGKEISEAIKARYYDLVIFGQAHITHKGMPEHFEDVCNSYNRQKVAMVFGSDMPIQKNHIQTYYKCAAWLFSREIVAEELS